MKISQVRYILLMLTLLFLSKACPPGGGRTGIDSNNEPAKPIINLSFNGNRWKPEWTDRVYKELSQPPSSQLLSLPLSLSDAASLGCPLFNRMTPKDKKKFWAIVSASMSHNEGMHDPKYFYDEVKWDKNNPKKQSKMNDSYGLFQIDAPNMKKIGCTNPDGSALKGGRLGPAAGGDMYKPHTNIRCGLQKLRSQLSGNNGKLFTSRSYWAVFRPGRSGSSKLKNTAAPLMRQISACRNNSVGEKADSQTEDSRINQGKNSKSYHDDGNGLRRSKNERR